MRYIKLFDNYQNIESICKEYNIENYIINSDNTVDVNGYVFIANKKLTEIPLQFGRIEGHFNIGSNNLISLKGSPHYIGDIFSCRSNNLTSLEYCPKYIDNNFYFERNNIYSLDGIGKVRNSINYYYNPIIELIDIFNNDVEIYLEYLDIYNFQKDRIIYKTRFMDALVDFGIEESPELKNYIYQ